MIRIGYHLFDEEAISHIELLSSQALSIYLYGDPVTVSNVDAAAEFDRLEQLLCPVPVKPPYGDLEDSDFTAEEQASIMDALGSNYRYLAKDLTGQVFCFREKPLREGAYWEPSVDGQGDFTRIHLPFAQLDTGRAFDIAEGRYI